MRLLDKFLAWAFYKRRPTEARSLLGCPDITASYVPISDLEAERLDWLSKGQKIYFCVLDDENGKHGRSLGLLHNLKGKAIHLAKGSSVYILYQNSFFETAESADLLFGGYRYFIYGKGYTPLEYWEVLKDTEYAPYIFAEIFGDVK